jgi:Arc/MetJ family transcription regulator
MRTAIYVADELWDTAADLYPTEGASALVQRGLRALLRESSGTPELAAIIDAMADDVRAGFVERVFGTDDG